MSVSNSGQVELCLEIPVCSSVELYLKIGPSVGTWYLFIFLKFFQGRAPHSFHCGMPIISETPNKHDFNSEKRGQDKRQSEGRKSGGSSYIIKFTKCPSKSAFTSMEKKEKEED